MSILFGHPTGTPFAHHAALAHFNAGRLEAFCVPWVPSALTLQLLGAVPGLRRLTRRLARRRFAPLAAAPMVQGRWSEWARLIGRLSGADGQRLAHEANNWLMRTMRREGRHPAVTAVHAYEDCALWPFEAAKRRGQACVYDMPIGYYPAWQARQAELHAAYADWLPAGAQTSDGEARLAQKCREMELADVVLAPSRFAETTIRRFFPDKAVVLAPYGVDLDFWTPPPSKPPSAKLRFIFVGQVSIRKGIPGLIEAWEKAALRDAELELVGPWQLSDRARASLPAGIVVRPPCDPASLSARYRAADVVVFPSFFEGFGMALLEGMACGLPALASDATIAPEIVTPASGRIVPAGDSDAMIESLRWFAAHRDDLPAMGAAARAQAEHFSWERYRRLVTQAVSPYA